MLRITVEQDSFQHILDRTNSLVARRAWFTAQQAASLLEAYVLDEIDESDIITDRPPSRRKKNTTRLVNSFTSEVLGVQGSLPVTAVLRLKPGVNEKKIAALEHGSVAHFIYPKPGSGEGQPGWLAFPRTADSGLLTRVKQFARIRSAYGRGPTFATKDPLFHPGNRAYGFMRKARARVIARLKSQ